MSKIFTDRYEQILVYELRMKFSRANKLPLSHQLIKFLQLAIFSHTLEIMGYTHFADIRLPYVLAAGGIFAILNCTSWVCIHSITLHVVRRGLVRFLEEFSCFVSFVC